MITIAWIGRDELALILPLLQTLNEGTERSVLEERLQQMSAANYRCAGAFRNRELLGICGVWTLYKHYVGKHIELDNVVVAPAARNQGVGEKLVAWLQGEATREGCVAAEINCYVHNSGGLKFWLNQGYTVLGFHCQKKW